MEQQTTRKPPRLPRRRFARGQSRPDYLQPGDVDAVMIMLVALMSEVSALRDRLDTHEAVADLGGVVTTAAIEAYELTPERHAAREANRQAMLKRVLRVVTEERDAAAADGSAKRSVEEGRDMTLTLDLATQIATFAFAEGPKRGITVMSVVVTDPGGHIRLAMRGDGQGNFGIDTALGKARAALGFNRSSLALQKIFIDPCGVAAINGATGGAFVPLGGAVVVQRDGVTIGAASISGGLPDVDHDIITQAVEAVGLTALA